MLGERVLLFHNLLVNCSRRSIDKRYPHHVGHDAALGFLGDSALLIMVAFFVVAALIVFRGLREPPK